MPTTTRRTVEDDIIRSGVEDSPSDWKTNFKNNKGALLILLSCITGSSMDAQGRLLQQSDHGMHPLQIIVARMGITFLLSTIYMYYKDVPNFPFGSSQVRPWLVLRALLGFLGLFCLYYSVHYLPLAEATIFRFLVPITTALACSSFLGERLSTKELGAGVVALLGIVVIAHPANIFDNVIHDIRPHETDTFNELTPRQHLIAIIVAIIGIFGASGAYTMIRIIEHRAHTLISVNYFAILSTVVSAVALLVIPDIGFTMPEDVRQWCLLLSMGFLGFALQFLLTAGLQLDRSSRATSMMYSQLIFALMYDFVIWGMLPGMWTLIGGAIVTASTLWAALQRKVPTATIKDVANDEESALLQHRRVDEQISAKRSSFEA